MRHASTSALLDERPAGEFGTGLRSRLELVRTRQEETKLASVLAFRNTGRRDFSPELALVSPNLSLGGLMLEEQVATDAPLGTLLAEAGLLESTELDFALAHAREHGKRLGEVLVEHGLVSLADLRDRLSISLVDEPYDTVGGMVFGRLGRVAKVGDSVEVEGYRFTVMAVDGRRVAQVKVQRIRQPKRATPAD